MGAGQIGGKRVSRLVFKKEPKVSKPMGPELIRGTLSLIILSLLSREPMYGYGIVATVKAETASSFEWKEGSLYPALHKLEKASLIESKWETKSGERRRKYYHITDAGRRELAQKTDSWKGLTKAINRILEGGK